MNMRTAIALQSVILESCHRSTGDRLGGSKQARRRAKPRCRGKPRSRVGGESSSTRRLQGVLAIKRHGYQTEGESKDLTADLNQNDSVKINTNP